MGISTVSGPFRSKNGFQELVDGVWTPVGGGGVSSSLIYTEAPAAPVNLDLTEVGKSITIVGTSGTIYSNFVVPLIFNTLTSGVGQKITGLLTIAVTGTNQLVNSSLYDPYFLSFNLTAPFEVTFTAIGLFTPSGDYVDKQIIAISGWAWWYDVPYTP